MNILQVQDQLKGLSQDQLVREMQTPSGSAPQYLVLSEITRRQKMQNDLMARQAKGPQTTVAQEAVAAAGVPQAGLPGIAQAMAPKTDVTNNTGAMPMPTPMPSESPVGMADGGLLGSSYPAPPLAFLRDPAILAMATRMGVRPGQLWQDMDPQVRAAHEARLSAQGSAPTGPVTREQYLDAITAMSGVNPSYDPVAVENETRPGFIMPSQSELDTRYRLGQMPPSLGNLDVNTTTLAGLPALSAADISPLAPARIVLPSMSSDSAPGLLYGAPVEPTLSPYDVITAAYNDRARAEEKSAGAFMPSRTDLGPTANELLAASAAAQGPSAASMQALAAQPEDPLSAFGGAGPEPSILEQIFSTAPDPAVAAKLEDVASQVYALQNTDTGTPLTKEDAQKAADEAKAITEAAANNQGGTGAAGIPAGGGTGGAGGGSGGASSGAGKMSSFEQELMDAISRSEKRAEQDKWLALAQAGLEIMNAAGRQGTFAGAVGEGGAKGIAAFREGRDNAENTRLNLLKQLEDARMARAALAARSAGGGGGGGSRGNYTVGQMMDDALGQLKTANDILSTSMGLDPSTALAAQNLRDNALRVLTGGQGGGTGTLQLPSARQ